MESPNLTGQQLEGTPYRLHRLLGAGAHGEVYLGEHVALGKRVVIKLIRVALVSRADIVHRFRREARVLVGIEHPAIIEPTDLGETRDGRTFFVMGYVEGTSLREVLKQRIIIPPREACLMMAETADGLHAAHQQGVIHRDIKPENLLLTAKGRIKVLDFGIAKAMQEAGATGTQTANGFVLGTPRYMAPEQAKGETLSPATDVYALTCVLFELLTGTPFAEGEDARELIRQHAFAEAPTLSQRARKAFAPDLEAIVARGVRKDPRQRFASAADCAEALRGIVASLDGASTTPAPAPAFRESAASDPGNATDVDAAYSKPTVKFEQPYLPAGAVPTAAFGAASVLSDPQETRAVRGEALVVGTATTDHAPIVGRLHHGPETTAPTEMLPAVPSTPPPGSSTEDAYLLTASEGKKRSTGVPLGLVIPAGLIAVAAIAGAILIFGRNEPERGKKKDEPSAATASIAETKSPTNNTESPSAVPIETAAASTETAPIAATGGTKPKTPALPTEPTSKVKAPAESLASVKPAPTPSATVSAKPAVPSGKAGKMGGGTEDRE